MTDRAWNDMVKDFRWDELGRAHGKVKTDLQNKWKEKGLCPDCGDEGKWIAMALVCPQHRKFLG